MSELTLRGTPAQLAGRIQVNGVVLDQPAISMLTRLGVGSFAKKIDTVKRGDSRGGKPATIWEFKPKAVMNFDAVTAQAVKKATAANQPEKSITLSESKLEEIIVRAVAQAVATKPVEAAADDPAA